MQIPTVILSELQNVPYIANPIPQDGRAVFLQPYFDLEKKQWLMPHFDEEKVIFLFAEPRQSFFYGVKHNPKDFHLQFFDDVIRFYSYNSVMKPLFGITRDITNCSVIIERYFLYLRLNKEKEDTSLSNFVSADIESLFYNLRSMYDSLQVLLRSIWSKEAGKQLPQSFSEMIAKYPDELLKKYGLPKEIIELYKDANDLFILIKGIRDDIVHQSIDCDTVFCFKDGFALQLAKYNEDPIARKFDIWEPEKIKQNGLVSILALYAHLINSVLKQFNAFSKILTKVLPKQPMIKDEYVVLYRAPYNMHLNKLDDYLREQWMV